MNLDPFFNGVFDLPIVGRHLVARLQTDHGHFLIAETADAAGGINGDVAAANNDNIIAQAYRLAFVDSLQDGDASMNSVQVDPGYRNRAAHREPNGNDDRVMRVRYLPKADIRADIDVGLQFDP